MRAGFLLATCVRTFPAPTGSSAEGKNFSLVTPPGIAVRNSLPAWVKSRIQLGAPGTRNPGAARLRGGGRGRRPPRSRGTTRGSRGRGRGARPGLDRARPPPPQPRRAGIVSSAPAAPCARPPGADRPRRQAPRRPAVRPSGRASVPHGLCALAFPPPSSSRPQWRRQLRVSSSGARGPAPRTGAASRAAAPPFSRAGDGRERGGEAEQRKRGGGPGPARGGGSFCLTGRGCNSATAPAARGAEAARRRRGRGGLPRGRPNRPQPGEGRREPVSARGVDAADGGGGGRAAGGPPPHGRRGPAPAPGSSRPREASATPAARVSLYGPNWCKEVVRVQPRFAGGRYLFSAAALRQPLMARSGCRKPPPLLAAASSHAGPSWLPAAGGPSEETKLLLEWGVGGDRGPRNCLKTVPLLGETLDALRTRRTAYQPLRFSGLQVVQSRWPW